MSKIIDTSNLHSKNDKIFFGDYGGFQRYDSPVFPVATKLEESMRGAFWNPSEISMRNDAVKFHSIPESIQEVLCSIWFYQTLMDSAQNRGIEETISQFVTNPEWESVFKTWAYFEMIHSISYSHIIRGIFVSSTPVFEKNFSNADIIERVQTEIDAYNYLSDLDLSECNESNIKKIIELILSIYALEGIKFYASFLITYLIHDQFACIPGASRIIKLINFDEDFHTKVSVVLLNTLKQDDNFKPYLDSPWFEETARKCFNKVISDEKSFADYLVAQGGIDIPVSRDGVHKFLDYYYYKRLTDIGITFKEEIEKPSLVDWFEIYKDLNKENIAMQESDMAVYTIGTMKDDL